MREREREGEGIDRRKGERVRHKERRAREGYNLRK
jgi:hypothetical protein